MSSSSDLDAAPGNTPKALGLHETGTLAPPEISSFNPFLKTQRALLARMLAVLITKSRPRGAWYATALSLIPLQSRIERTSGVRRLDHLDEWMKLLTHFGGAFAIPCKVVGREFLPQPGSAKNGILYCSGHLPMVRVGLRALIELGHLPAAALAHPVIYAPGTQMVPVWGSTKLIPGIAVGSYALLKARSILKRGQSVAMLTDVVTGGKHSPNAFRLARRVGAQIVFFFTEVLPDGSILVSFKEPPFPVLTSDESIEKNIEWLAKELNRIVEGYG